MCRMAPLTVRKHCAIFQYCSLGLRVCVKVLQIHHCSLEGMKAALRYRLIPTVALAAHPRLHPVLGQEWPIAGGAILTAAIGLQEKSRCGLPLPDGHRPGLVHPLGPPLGSPGPPDHGPRAQSQHDGKRQPACAGREGGNSPNREGLGCLHCPRPVALLWGYRLGLPGGRRGFAAAPCCAAPARRGQHAPQATAAPLSSRLGSQRLAPARAVRATPLRTRGRSCGLHGLLSFPLGAGRPTKPLIRAPARDLQEPTHAPDAARRVLLVYPGGLYGSWCAQYAAAFFQLSRAAFKRVLSFRRRFHAS